MSDEDESKSNELEKNNINLNKFLQTQLEILLTGPNAIKYGEKLPSSLSNINITDINLILEDKNFPINNPESEYGDYNCIKYDNSTGLINDKRKDPMICGTNNESKCTLSAFTDKNINNNDIAETARNYKSYNTYIGSSGLNIKKEIVSCNGNNIPMWIYNSNNPNKSPAIGIPVEKCNSISLTSTDLDGINNTYKAICKQPISFVLKNTNNGYICNILPNTDKNNLCDSLSLEEGL